MADHTPTATDINDLADRLEERCVFGGPDDACGECTTCTAAAVIRSIAPDADTAALATAISLAVGDNAADELRRISGPGTTSTAEGADCRNVLRNLANVLDGTWTTVPSDAAEGFGWATDALHPHTHPDRCPTCGRKSAWDDPFVCPDDFHKT